MNHDPLDDPMLDGIDQWHATAGTYSLDDTYIPDGSYVRLDDLPALIAVSAKAQEHTYNAGYAAALRDAVEAVWAVAGEPIGNHGRLEQAVAAIEALGGER